MKAFDKLGINECPYCGTRTLCVHEVEETTIPLDDTGMKDQMGMNNTIDYTVELICSKCGETFEARTAGGHWCIGDFTRRSADIVSFNPFYKEETE